jgi:hypothetical protein
MALDYYTNIAIKFAEDTREWGGISEFVWYTTTNNTNDWVESSDNAHGGMDISWAFHLTENKIRELAPYQFINEIRELLQLAVDDGWDKDGLQSILDLLD